MTRIGSGYNSYSAETLTQLLSATNKTSVASRGLQKVNTADVSSQNAMINKIEKHVDDVKKGHGDSSKDVAYLLGRQSANASEILSRTNPRALALYSGYLSALRYDRAARFVNGVEYGLSSLTEMGEGNDKNPANYLASVA